MDHLARAVVIEDEDDVLELLSGHLSRLGLRVRGVQTGREGLSLALADPPDLVVVDVLLPDMDGREIVERLRGDPRTRGCALVLCSVLDRADLVNTSADAVLAKPFGKAAVADLVRSLVRRRAAGREEPAAPGPTRLSPPARTQQENRWTDPHPS
ncbi:MAG TPA: response regulator [Pilimelia sp.]|nr:response regulator [Pilimelia sp.]